MDDRDPEVRFIHLPVIVDPFGRSSPTGGLASRYAASGVVQNPSQQEFDLRVGAPQLIGGPTSQRVVDGGVEAEQDVLAFSHRRDATTSYW